MRVIASLFLISALSGCTADQQARFTAGYYGESGHTFAEAMSDVAGGPARMAGGYCTGYANAYNPAAAGPHGQAMVITPGGQNSFIYW